MKIFRSWIGVVLGILPIAIKEIIDLLKKDKKEDFSEEVATMKHHCIFECPSYKEEKYFSEKNNLSFSGCGQKQCALFFYTDGGKE